MNIPSQPDSQLYALSKLGLLKVSGAGAQKLLQGQLTCDVDALAAGKGVMGAHCNPQGRIISLFYLMRVADDFYLVMPQNLIPIAFTALKKYAPFYKAELSDATNSLIIAGSINTDTNHSLAHYTLIDGRQLHLLAQAPTEISNDEITWHHHDVLAGIPAVYAETSGLFLPHDLNLPQLNAVSFSKGCFTGQEIIARMHYRGKPKSHLYLGFALAELLPATSLYSESRVAGTVIDSSKKMYNNRYAFLFVTDEASVAANKLQTEQNQLIEIQQSE